MPKQDNFLERLRVAAPCHVSWDGMKGDERVRFCSACSLHVYDISELTKTEARALIANAEGRVCARLYRRADGTVLTRDCPVGLRAVRRRAARTAGAALTAILSLFSVVAAGQPKQKHQSKRNVKVSKTTHGLTIERSPSGTLAGSLAVEVIDPAGAVITGAIVTLTNERTGEKISMTTNERDALKLIVPSADEYTFEVSASYFQTEMTQHLFLSPRETARARVSMQINPGSMEMGVILVTEPPPDDKSNGKTIFKSKEITSLPHG
jgi:hypothetical protein